MRTGAHRHILPLKENGHVRNSFVGTLDPHGFGQRAHLATQSQLGVFPKWRVWIDFVDPSHSGSNWACSNRSITVANTPLSETDTLTVNRFLSIVLFLILIIACVGFCRGWFSMTAENEPLTEKLDVHFQVDRDKMKQDANAVEDKTKALFSSENGERKIP